MSSEANPTRQGDLSSFDAPVAGAGAVTCTSCSKEITDTYHEANGAIVCSRCRAKVESELKHGSGAGGFMRALVLGLGGAALGALLYFAVLKLTGYEIGLIAIAVGFMVGHGVQMGSGGRRGFKYQALAVALTYSAIVVTYIPFILEGLEANVPADVAARAADSLATGGAAQGTGIAGAAISLVVLFAMAALSPILMGFENIIGLLIIGFALYQAWSMNKRIVVTFTGPYRINAPGASGGPAAA